MTPLPINALPTAPEGSVTTLPFYSVSDFTRPSTSILCRNTAPLVSFAFSLIRRRVPCVVLGRNIGAGLTALIKRLRPIDLPDLERKLDLWLERETTRCRERSLSPETYLDQHECILIFLSDATSLTSLTSSITSLFSETAASNQVTLCTIHRAKGSEWTNVLLLDWHLIPSRYAVLLAQRQQELNLQYVAVTRAMSTLTFISSNCWREILPTQRP